MDVLSVRIVDFNSLVEVLSLRPAEELLQVMPVVMVLVWCALDSCSQDGENLPRLLPLPTKRERTIFLISCCVVIVCFSGEYRHGQRVSIKKG